MEQFTYVKRGYDPEEVDRYISTMEQVIKSYKEKDNAIKNAIISAQIAADNMVKNAKAQADEYKSLIAKELDKVLVQVNHQRQKVKTFQDVYSGLVHKYLTELDYSDIEELNTRLDEVDKLIAKLKEVDIVPATGGDLVPPSKPNVSQETSPFKPPVSQETSPFKPPVSQETSPFKPHLSQDTSPFKMPSPTLPPMPPPAPASMTPPLPPLPSQQSLAPQISLGPTDDDMIKVPLPSLPLSQLPPLPPLPSSMQNSPLPPPTTTAKFNEDGTYVPGQ
ncbi:MAG: DivIVA domain-containing protein [Defluviitaleaceae bacterium]|nr:DivIVA domain-containing protein [Defluviitaleaceae bacterium]